MDLKNATSIDDVAYEDVIDFRTLADWLRNFADPDLYEPEEYENDIAEAAAEAVAAIIDMLAEMGLRYPDSTVADWSRVADDLQEMGNNYGAALIRDTYWIDYVKEYASEISTEEAPTAWPYNHVDWDAAADEFAQDYSEVTLAGVNFLVRDF